MKLSENASVRGELQPEERLRAAVVARALGRIADADDKVVSFDCDLLQCMGGKRATSFDRLRAAFKALPRRDRVRLDAEYSAAQHQLARRFGWSADVAGLFILSGEVHAPPPVRVKTFDGTASDYTETRIILDVVSWVSPRSVMAIYASAQHKLFGHRHRPLTEKVLRRFDVADAARSRVETWRAIGARIAKSRRAKSRRRRSPTWRQVRRDVERTRQALLPPRPQLDELDEAELRDQLAKLKATEKTVRQEAQRLASRR